MDARHNSTAAHDRRAVAKFRLFLESKFSKFKSKAESIEKQFPVDARAIPAFWAGLALFSFEACYILLTNLTFKVDVLFTLFTLLAMILLAGLLARRYGMPNTGDTLQAFALPPVFAAMISVATVILTRYSYPFSDVQLAAMDKVIGIDWKSILFYLNDNPELANLALRSYNSFYWQFSFIAVAIFLVKRPDIGWRFINAWALALLATAAIYPFFTAEGPYVHYGIKPSDIPNIHREFAWGVGDFVEQIRSGRNNDAAGTMAGLVYFPSFHAAAGVLYTWSCWSFRWARIVILPLNLGLIASTPVMGSHYISDVVAGIVVALGAILASNRLVTAIERRMAGRPDPGIEQGSQPAQSGS